MATKLVRFSCLKVLNFASARFARRTPIFRDLAMLDYDRAIELAKGFHAEGPRAIATIAIARAILHPKKEASQKTLVHSLTEQ